MKWLTFVLTAVLFVGCVTSANGDVVNGSFESGFAGWTGVGPNSAFPSFDGELPTDGGSLAFLSNGSGSLSVAIHDIILTAAIGSPAGSIAGLFGGTEGAIAFQTFSLDPNQNGVNFDWNFLTTEATPSAFNDFAFASIWDSTGSLVSSFVLDTFSTFPGSGTAFPSHTGWLSGSFSSLTPGGTYSLVFGVFDEVDTTFDSALLIDNVRGNVVPEPTGLAFVLGFVCLAGLNSRRRKQSGAIRVNGTNRLNCLADKHQPLISFAEKKRKDHRVLLGKPENVLTRRWNSRWKDGGQFRAFELTRQNGECEFQAGHHASCHKKPLRLFFRYLTSTRIMTSKTVVGDQYLLPL